MPLERATVHVEDRGLQFSDAVYEVVRTYGGHAFAVDEHLARLFQSLDAVEIQPVFSAAQLHSLIDRGITRAGFPEAMVYLQISRGQARRHRGFPANAKPNLILTVRKLEDSSSLRATGLRVITVPDTRWLRCDIKSVALLANVLAYQQARHAGAQDAIFVESDGTVNEATAGNIFVASRGGLRTPPQGPRLLSGVTRDKILQAARAVDIPAAAERITRTDLLAADEIFFTSTTAEVVPVVAVDGERIGMGTPGPVAGRIYEQFYRMFALPLIQRRGP